MNNKAHLRPSDYDKNGDIIPDSVREDKGDLISREALRNVILNDRKLDGANANWEVNRILVHIDNAPSVEAFTKEDMSGAYNEGYACGSRENTRPQGKWIDVPCERDLLFNTGIRYTCSVCGKFNSNGHSSFCPNCGADMRIGGVE